MTIDDLVRQGSVHRFDASREEIAKVMDIARRDLGVAESMLDKSMDWSYTIAYNAVLQACRAYIFHLGYRPASTEAHKVTFQFMQLVVDEPFKASIDYFDRVRRKRHRTLYDEPGLISQKEVKELLKRAREFLTYVEAKLKG